MNVTLTPIGRLYVLPYYRALEALARHLDDCPPCESPARPDCPEGAALTANLRAAKACQTEAARWN